MKKIIFVFVVICCAMQAFSQDAERKFAYDNYIKYSTQAATAKDSKKEASIQKYRDSYSKSGGPRQLNGYKESSKAYLSQLTEEGQFADLVEQEKKIIDEKLLSSVDYNTSLDIVAPLPMEALNRIWKIADGVRRNEIKVSDVLADKYLKAIIRYGNIETGRSNKAHRFHASCFAIPAAAVGIYFSLLKQMDEVEAGKSKNLLLKEACTLLKELALQSWTQPLRNDFTDTNVVQIERFRNHVWWVGGNALAYRPLLATACMIKSIPMIDLLAETSQRALSTVSQETYKEAFWNEGFTADGAGWGHGKQCLIWGYPIDGGNAAMGMLAQFKGTAWEKKLSQENKETLMGYFRGGNWYHYKGNQIPCLSRGSFAFNAGAGTIPSLGLANSLTKDWSTSLTKAEQAEVSQFILEANVKAINMQQYNAGIYNGTRWFFNNDDLIKKNSEYHIMVNMASSRCNGLESAASFADGYNFFPCDGMTLFQRNGTEYKSVYGAWDITASPGVTAREGMDKIKPIENWRGFNSKFNFAGAATAGTANAVAGFVFEKWNGSDNADVNDKGNSKGENECIYGVQAHKAYFMQGDYTIALGAGINNLKPQLEGNIRTTIDQTAKENDVLVLKNGNWKNAEPGVQSFYENGQPVWVKQQDKFAYTVLPEYSKKAYYTCETKKTDWVKMNNSNKGLKNLPDSASLLRLWIDHGREVKNDSYGYVVYAGQDNPPAQLPFTVLQNDTSLQAVKSNDGSLYQAVFYQGNAELNKEGVLIKVSAPCVLQLELIGKEFIASVQDPQMNKDLKEVTVSFGAKSFVFELPKGKMAGSPVVQQVSFK